MNEKNGNGKNANEKKSVQKSRPQPRSWWRLVRKRDRSWRRRHVQVQLRQRARAQRRIAGVRPRGRVAPGGGGLQDGHGVALLGIVHGRVGVGLLVVGSGGAGAGVGGSGGRVVVELVVGGVFGRLGIEPFFGLLLLAQLGQPQAGPGLVAHVHRLAQPPLGVEDAVEGKEVEADGEEFDGNLDDGTHHDPVLATISTSKTATERSTHLLAANKGVVDGVLKQLAAHVVLASPAPEILAVVARAAGLHDSDSCRPHGDREDEDGPGKDGGVQGDAFGSVVTASPVAEHDEEREGEGDAGNDEDGDLGPFRCVRRPRTEIISFWQASGCVEDGEGGCYKSEDNQAIFPSVFVLKGDGRGRSRPACAVDTPKHNLEQPQLQLESLYGSVRTYCSKAAGAGGGEWCLPVPFCSPFGPSPRARPA